MSRRWLLVIATVVVLGLHAAGGSVAQSPDVQGWWWSARDPALPVELPPPAEVPDDGLYVASNITGQEAIAALMFVIPEGAIASTLTLQLASPPTGTGDIVVCPTIGPWQAAHAGSWPSRPRYQCAPEPPRVTLTPDGTSISFNLGELGTTRLIDVALVPGEGSNIRAAFNKPGPDALNVRQAPSSGSADETPSFNPAASSASSDSGVVVAPDPAAASTPFFASDFGTNVQPLTQTAPPPQVGAAPSINLSPTRSGVPVARTTTSRAQDDVRTLGMFGLILLAALYSRYSSQPQREPRSLVHFGRRGDVPTEAAE